MDPLSCWSVILMSVCFFMNISAMGTAYTFDVIYMTLQRIYPEYQLILPWIGTLHVFFMYGTGKAKHSCFT